MTVRDKILYQIYLYYFNGFELNTEKLIDIVKADRVFVYNEVKKLVESGLVEKVKGTQKGKLLRPAIKSKEVLMFLYKLVKG